MNFPTIDRSFFAGECFDAYRVLGAHPCRDDFGQEGWRFAVWAPGAVAVEICGGFDGWGPAFPCRRPTPAVWSGFGAPALPSESCTNTASTARMAAP